MADELLSIGIDIGTSTTQVIFSRLSIENTSGYFSVPQIRIVDKQVIYKGEVYSTPLKTRTMIDADAVAILVEGEFKRAGFTPRDTRTGAVIITGETARKDNAALVLERLSGFAGDFVVSTAGPDLESIIAGKGSGARQYSEDRSCVVANIDIGGGTSNLVLFDRGETVCAGCLDIGGRLIRVSPDLYVDYVSESVRRIARWKGISIAEGERTSREALERISRAMNQVLEQVFGLRPREGILSEVQTPGSGAFSVTTPVDAYFFSGGVADAIYGDPGEPFRYGDIGMLLGAAVKGGRLAGGGRLVRPDETIHATVVGAGTYTTTISGSTITYTKNIFPMKNVPVLCLSGEEQDACFEGRSEVLEERMRWFGRQNDSEQLVLAMKGRPNPGYAELKRLAEALARAADAVYRPETPLLIIVECDMAKALGQAAYHAGRGGREVVALDSIRVGDNDYVDMGRPLMGGLVVPVVVKTLVFG